MGLTNKKSKPQLICDLPFEQTGVFGCESMRRKVTRSSTRIGQKNENGRKTKNGRKTDTGWKTDNGRKTENGRKTQKVNRPARQDNAEFKSFISEIIQNHISRTEKGVRESLRTKNDFIKELQTVNAEFKKQLKECKRNLKEKDDQIEVLDNEKEEFKRITFSEVEKFDETYQNKIEKLEVEKQEMKSNYEKLLAENQSKLDDNMDVSAKDNGKISKLFRKYKDLKVKIKSKDLEIFKKEQEKKDLWKYIDSKVEIFKTKNTEVLDMENKLNKELANSKELEEELKKKDSEIEELKLKIIKDDEVIELMKRQSDVLNEERKNLKLHLKTKDDQIKMKDISILDIEQKLKDEQEKSSSLQILNSRNEFIDEELKIKDREIGELKRKILNDEETLDATKIQHEVLTEEYKKLDMQWNEELIETKRVKDTENEKIMSEKTSLEEVNIEFKKILAEKDEKNKSLEEGTNLMYKDLVRNRQEKETFHKIIKSKDVMIKTLQAKMQERTGNAIGQQFVEGANRGLDVEETRGIDVEEKKTAHTDPTLEFILEKA